MPDPVKPSYLPASASIDTIILEGWKYVLIGEDPDWVPVGVPLTEIVSTSTQAVAARGGGDCTKKVELVMDLAAKKWKPEDIERVLKAL